MGQSSNRKYAALKDVLIILGQEECVKGMGLIEVYKMIQHEKEAIIEVNKIQRYTE